MPNLFNAQTGLKSKQDQGYNAVQLLSRLPLPEESASGRFCFPIAVFLKTLPIAAIRFSSKLIAS
jgi:hypothetical protein